MTSSITLAPARLALLLAACFCLAATAAVHAQTTRHVYMKIFAATGDSASYAGETTNPSINLAGPNGSISTNSNDKEGWILLDNASFGATIPINLTGGTGNPAAGRVVFSEINVSKLVDRVSPLIFYRLCQGGVVGTIIIEYVSSGPGTTFQTTFRVELKNVYLQNLANSVDDGQIPKDLVTLQASGLRYTSYRVNLSGAVDTTTPTVTQWNQVNNSGTF